MKTLAVVLLWGAAALGLQAQYKAPSQYFRKDFPAPVKAGQQQQQQPPQQHHATGNPQATNSAAPKFKDVGTNSSFFFMTDTNRSYPWMKISSSVATNTKTGAKVTLSPQTPVQR